jgi:RNA-directed DNA polymerase
MKGTSSPAGISTRLQGIARLAREASEMVFTTLAHHIDETLLKEAYRRTRKSGAVGVDGQSGKDYEEDLEENLRSLLSRFKSGTYKAPAVRRVHIPKGDGEATRPIGIPTFEDKVLQRAVLMVLEAVYEQDFLSCSYGFRPGRSAHQALDETWQGLMKMGGGWVLEVDIQGYFDTLNHGHLRKLLDQRVRDGVIRRVIDKWLKAGVLEEEGLRYPEAGTPQGGVLSPLLANIYLHEVLDVWFERRVKPKLLGRAFLVRYADDSVMIFSSERDARRVMEALPRRFGQYGLTLHPEKTRLVRFVPPRVEPDRGGEKRKGEAGTFDLLGFTHYWGRSQRGNWVIKRKTAGSRLRRVLKKITQWCRANRHRWMVEQHQELVRKLQGHFGYYGITGNFMALSRYLYEVCRIWKKWLDRRSQRSRMTWERFNGFLKRYPLPKARVVHSVHHCVANP